MKPLRLGRNDASCPRTSRLARTTHGSGQEAGEVSANRNVGQEAAIKDDGIKYTAINAAGERIYRGEGVTLAEAVRLALGLKAPAGVARVENDGSLTPGNVNKETGEFNVVGERSAAVEAAA